MSIALNYELAKEKDLLIIGLHEIGALHEQRKRINAVIENSTQRAVTIQKYLLKRASKCLSWKTDCKPYENINKSRSIILTGSTCRIVSIRKNHTPRWVCVEKFIYNTLFIHREF